MATIQLFTAGLFERAFDLRWLSAFSPIGQTSTEVRVGIESPFGWTGHTAVLRPETVFTPRGAPGGGISPNPDGRVGRVELYDAAGNLVMVITGLSGQTVGSISSLVSGGFRDHIIGSAGDDVIRGAGSFPEEFTGGTGRDLIEAGAGADTVHGGDGDTINGGAGGDLIDVDRAFLGTLDVDGGADRDTLDLSLSSSSLDIRFSATAAAGAVTLRNVEVVFGSSGGNRVAGSEAADAFVGGAGLDVVDGAAGDDLLAGLGGDDVLRGGAGDDLMDGGLGDDLLDGGEGVDEIDYSASPVGLTVDLGATSAQQTGFGRDVLLSIENLYASIWSDVLIGNDGRNVLDGLNGADILVGGAGDDRLIGGFDNDFLMGGAGDDVLLGGGQFEFDIASYADAAAGVRVDLAVSNIAQNTGGAGTDTLFGLPGLIGSGFADALSGTAGANYLDGGDGDDVLNGRGGADTLTGGAGDDVATFASTRAENVVTVNADGTVVVQGPEGRDLLLDIERLQFTDEVVTVTSSSAGLRLSGGPAPNSFAGVDVYAGRAGADTLDGGDSGDILFGRGGADLLYGGAGQDSLFGEEGADLLFGGAGIDLIDGGEGDDVAYGAADADVMRGGAGADLLNGETGDDQLWGGDGADLLTGEAGRDHVFGGADGDVLLGGTGDDVVSGDEGDDALFGELDQDVLYGGAGGDTVNGMVGDDLLYGDAGADVLSGELGADVLIGGLGADVLIGGAGADRFVFLTVTDSQFGDGGDLIVDFAKGSDVIDLSLIDADLALAGDQAFVFVGALSGAAGQATLTFNAATGRTVFRGDVDGDGSPDVVLSLLGQVGQTDGWAL